MRFILILLPIALAAPLHARDAELAARDAEIDRLHLHVAALQAQLEQIQGSSNCTRVLDLEGRLETCLQARPKAAASVAALGPTERPLLRTEPAVIPGTSVQQLASQWRNKPWGSNDALRALSYSVTVANPTNQPVTVTARVEFLDSEGLLVARHDLEPIELRPGARHTFDGEKKFRAKEVNRVTTMRVVRR